jgi:integrase/recombinase XerD
MTPLAQALTDYLTIRRSLGYKLERAGKLLGRFVAYLNDVGAHTVTTEQALAWATMPSGADPNWLAHRLLVVRFASYLHTIDPAAEVPPADLLPARPCRATPYLYSDGDIAALIAAAGTLRSPLRAMTYKTLIGLLAVTGLRIGEAIRLDRDDIDWDHALLIVRDSKFGKSREIPLHETTVRALRDYSRERNQLYCGRPSVPAVFISTAGSRLLYCNVNWTFLRLVRRAGLKPRSGSCRPRLHDIRHSFAVRSLLEAYQTGSDVKVRLSLLSTYLGHVDPGATYWYLSAAPELLALAGQRLDDHLGGGS